VTNPPILEGDHVEPQTQISLVDHKARRTPLAWLAENSPTVGPIGALAILFVVFSITAGSNFFNHGNLITILAQSSVIAVMAAGFTFVLLLGEIDLSFASIAVLAGIACSAIYGGQSVPLLFGNVTWGAHSVAVAFVVPIIACLLVGIIAGALTAKLGVPSFIGTLGLLLLCDGWAFYWSQGTVMYDHPGVLDTLGGNKLWGIPIIAIVAAVVLLLSHLVLSQTRYGRYIYMIGSNRRAAVLAGVNTVRVTMSVFIISSMLAGFAGLLAVGRLGSAQPGVSSDYLLPVIAAVIVGGVSLFGGSGNIGATVIGVLIFGVLDNGLDQTAINVNLKPFMRGVILLLAIVINVVGLRLASRKRIAEQAELEAVVVPEVVTPEDRVGAAESST